MMEILTKYQDKVLVLCAMAIVMVMVPHHSSQVSYDMGQLLHILCVFPFTLSFSFASPRAEEIGDSINELWLAQIIRRQNQEFQQRLIHL